MSRKIKNNINIVKNQTLLLIDNIKVVNNLISINLKKKKIFAFHVDLFRIKIIILSKLMLM